LPCGASLHKTVYVLIKTHTRHACRLHDDGGASCFEIFSFLLWFKEKR